MNSILQRLHFKGNSIGWDLSDIGDVGEDVFTLGASRLPGARDTISNAADAALGPTGLIETAAEKAAKHGQAALDQLGAAPTINPFAPTDYTVAADNRDYVPEQGSTEYGNINLDPRSLDAQYAALDKMRGVVEGGGLDATDRANLDQIGREEGARERGSREAILQNAQARGVGGSGVEMLANLGSSQNATTNRNMRDTSVAGMAQQRSLQAMRDLATTGGNIHGQQYGEASDKAHAQDIINSFNTGNMFNAAQAYATNLNNTGNMNTELKNKTGFYNTQEVPQQNYQNQLDFVKGINNLETQAAAGKDKRIAGSIFSRAIPAATAAMTGGASAAGSAMGGARQLPNINQPQTLSTYDEFLNSGGWK